MAKSSLQQKHLSYSPVAVWTKLHWATLDEEIHLHPLLKSKTFSRANADPSGPGNKQCKNRSSAVILLPQHLAPVLGEMMA